MKKRFLVMILTSVIGLAGVLTLATASAASPSVGQRIWCGLWSGANLNFSLDAANCQPTQQNNSEALLPSRPSSPSNSSSTYVALGDSVAAGLGLSGSSGVCGRSSEAYSSIIARALNMQLASYACSGATVGDLFTAQRVDGPNPPAQLKQAFRGGTPDLITITAGANDAHWADFIKACYVGNCATTSSTRAANALLVSLQAKLYVALGDILARSHGNPPEVILTGYYQAFSPSCSAVQTQITPAELTWLHDETVALNETIQQVSLHFRFAKFAPVDFTGHDMCSANPWIQTQTDPAPFHPTAEGQAVIAQAVLAKVGQ